MNRNPSTSPSDQALDRLTFLRAEVKPPIDEPEDIADLGDDDDATLKITDLH